MEQFLYDVVLCLENQPRHVRSVASALSVNHMTVSRKLKLLLRMNVLDFKQVGRSKVYFVKDTLEAKNVLIAAHCYAQNKLVEENSLFRRVIEEVRRCDDVRFAMVFGSYAKKKASEGSDVDLFLATDQLETKQKIEGVHRKISVKIGEFDLKEELVQEVVKHHVLIKGAETYYERIHPKIIQARHNWLR